MAYPLFSQPQGPAIQISLFGDAAQVGAKLGQEIPNPITSIIKGGLEGYETGQRIQANDQNAQIRQNQIDQIPLQNEQQQIALENARIQKERNQLQLENETANAGLATGADAAKLKNQTAAADQSTEVINKGKDLLNNWDNYSSFEKGQILTGSQYSDVFSKDFNLYKQLAAGALPGLPPAQQQQVQLMLQTKAIRDANAAAIQRQRPAFIATQGQLFDNNALTGQLVGNTGLSADQIYNSSETKFVPQGSYPAGEDGKTLLLDGNGKPKYVEPVGGEKTTAWDVIGKNPLTGKYEKFGSTTDPEQQKLFHTYVGQYHVQSGQSQKAQIDALYNNVKKLQQGDNQQSAPASPPQTFDSGKAKPIQGPKPEPIEDSLARKTFGLDQEEYQKVKPYFNAVTNFSKKYVSDPAFRSSPQAQITLSSTVRLAANNIAFNEYETIPGIKEQYTEEDVKKYNSNLLGGFIQSHASRIYDTYIGGVGGADFQEYYEKKTAPFRANSPKDLYVKQRGPVLENSIKTYMTELQKLQEAGQSAPARNQQSQEKLSAFVGG